ncbi:hypothetical protein HDU67_009152, partial [Dinochytrium kinnereticum]
MEEQIKEVRKLAVSNVLAISKTLELYPYFHENGGGIVKDLMGLIMDHPLIAHDAVSVLVNLSSNEDFLEYMNEDKFLQNLVLTIILPKSILADLCCMLLNNLTKSPQIAQKLIPTDTPTTPTTAASQPPTTPRTTQYLDNLLEVFVRGVSNQYNPQANFHFLSGVFANISTTALGARCLRSRSNVDGVIRLAKVVPFTEHENDIRRGGVVAVVKNCCFDVESEEAGGMLLGEELNLLAYVLLPLCGSEDFEEEEMDGMPDELQFLEPTKTREPDPKIRLML